MPEHRIVSLIASATEIVAALGFEDRLVGRSHECDFPPTVARLPKCSEAKLDTNGSARQIDERVKSILRDAVSVYRVFEDELERLKPTLIITQTQCEVCAVSLGDVEQAVCNLVSSQHKIVALEPMELADVWSDIHSVAGALNATERADTLVANLQQRLSAIAARTSLLTQRPSIACIEWTDPLMAAGNWVPELVEIAGGIDLLGNPGKHSDWMTFNELSQNDPDVIAVMSCGWDIARTRQDIAALTNQPGWDNLKAVRTQRVFITDGNQYFNRPGPRLIESAEILAEILHPQTFNFGHKETGWQPLE